jgi:hypothetical protein
MDGMTARGTNKPGGTVGYPALPLLIHLSGRDSVCGWVRTKLREGYGVKECLWEWMVIFLSACVKGILWFFTNFHLQKKLSIFLRNDHDCKMIYTDR